MERVKQDGHTYWVVSISTQKSDIIPSERVTIWMDVTHSNQHYSIKERDEALQRASQLDEKITAIFDRINDYESAEAAVKELKPLVDRFEKEMHIVILGTPEGDQWELSIDDPKRSIIWDKLVNAHFLILLICTRYTHKYVRVISLIPSRRNCERFLITYLPVKATL